MSDESAVREVLEWARSISSKGTTARAQHEAALAALDRFVAERDAVHRRYHAAIDTISAQYEARLERVEAARQAIAELEACELGMYRECRAEGSDAEAAQHDSRLTAYRKALALLAAALSDVTPPPRGSGS